MKKSCDSGMLLRCLSNIPPHAYGEGTREGDSNEGEASDSSRIFLDTRCQLVGADFMSAR